MSELIDQLKKELEEEKQKRIETRQSLPENDSGRKFEDGTYNGIVIALKKIERLEREL